MKRKAISIFLCTIYLVPLLAPSPSDKQKKKFYFKSIKEAVGDLERTTLLTVVGSYFFHSGLLLASSFIAIQLNGLELWFIICSLVWLTLSVICLISGLRLIRMLDQGITDQPMWPFWFILISVLLDCLRSVKFQLFGSFSKKLSAVMTSDIKVPEVRVYSSEYVWRSACGWSTFLELPFDCQF